VAAELPLFPLKAVLFPGGPLALRVFEPRYVDMVARCLRGDNRFGVVAIRQGEEVGAATTYDVGTAAEIVDWHQDGAGLLGLRTVGRESFRLLRTRRLADGLYVGDVTWLDAPASRPLPERHAPLAALLKGLLEPLTLYRGLAPDFDDALWVGARLAELLPLSVAHKQTLLELPDAEQRLERLADLLRTECRSA
jgi:Lon protease-like protein